MSNHSEQIANQPKLLKKQAVEALAKAKELEQQQLKNGGHYMHVPHLRCHVLIKKKNQ